MLDEIPGPRPTRGPTNFADVRSKISRRSQSGAKWPLPVSAPGDLVTCERRRGRNVQRREVALYRNAYEHVATFARETRETPALGAEHEDDRLVGQVELEQAA